MPEKIKKIFFKTSESDHYRRNIDVLKARFPDIEFPIGKSEEDLQTHLPDADGVVAGRFWPNELEMARNLRALFIPFAGVDAFDVELIASRGILISNSHAASPYIAERALGLALALLGKICPFSQGLRKGYWHRDEFWTSLHSLKVGIWGIGSIGKAIAKSLKGFDCPVYGLSRRQNLEIDNFDRIYNDTDNFIAHADIYFITIPLTDKTRNIINNPILSKMKGKYLVHISRGAVVEEKALYDALSNNILKGAALDCWYSYPRGKKQPVFPSKYPFHELKNIVLSPHACSHAEPARAANIEQARKNIEAFIETGIPANLIDPTDHKNQSC